MKQAPATAAEAEAPAGIVGDASFRALVEHLPALVWCVSADGVPEYYSPPLLAYIGKTRDELDRPAWRDAVHPEDRAAAFEAWDSARRTGAPCSFDARFRRASDGAYRWLTSRAQPIREGGAVVRWVGTLVDVHDRVEMDAALSQSEGRARERTEELEGILQAAPAMIMIAYDTRCQRVTGNRVARELLRAGEATSLSKTGPDAARLAHFRVLRGGEEIAPEELPLQRAARGEDIQACDYELVFDDGARRHLYGNAVTLRDPEGRPRGAVGAFVDVTALRLAEQERERLLEREQAARAAAEAESRAKDEFLATVSHELRTPLNAILGWTQILLAQEHSHDTKHAITTIERNARLQARLVEDILDASRIVTGTLRLEARPVELAPLVQTVLESQKPAADAKGIHLSSKLDPMLGPVLGDPPRLQQVIWNLASNAVKFTPEHGTVSIALERAGKEARLVVRDTGAGIAPEFLPHLFRPFRQAETGASRRHGGLGLGLSIVQHLVELHGGTVGVESRGPGQGATFIVRLPLAERASVAPEAAGPESTRAAAALRGARILVVDDEPFARALLARILVDRGAVVRACASASEALSDLASWRPDVLVSDVGMPERDGYWLIDRVRALPEERGGATPALAITAYASVADRVRALSRGYQLHVPKPLDVDELVVSVAALVGRGGVGRHA